MGRGGPLFARPMDDEDLARKLPQVALDEDLQAQLAAAVYNDHSSSAGASRPRSLDVLKKVAQQVR